MPISQSHTTDRPLSSGERALVAWLLEHGNTRAQGALAQVSDLRVIAQCHCGCASVDFSVDGKVPSPKSGMEVVSDYWWRTQAGHLCGAFVFLRDNLLAGIDLWSIDGGETPSELPRIEDLKSYDSHRDA